MNARRIFLSLPLAVFALLITSPSHSEAVYPVLRSTRQLTESSGSFPVQLGPFNPALGESHSLVLKFELEINDVAFSVAGFCNEYTKTNPGHGAVQLLFQATTTLHVVRVSSFDRYGDFTYSKPVWCPADPGNGGGRAQAHATIQSNDLPIVIEIPLTSTSDTGYDNVFVSWAPLPLNPPGLFILGDL